MTPAHSTIPPRRGWRMRVGAFARRGLAFALLWWVLAEGRLDAWGVGLASVLLATLASLRLWPPGAGRVAPAGLAVFVGFFLAQSMRGGIQVAIQALRPRMDLAPAVLELPLTLTRQWERVLLVNTLNLLPGTVSIEFHGDRLHLHVLDHRQPVAEEVRNAEARIAAIRRNRP